MKNKFAKLIISIAMILYLVGCQKSNYFTNLKRNEFLTCDLNQDGKLEKIYLEEVKDEHTCDLFLIIEQDNKIFLKVPFFDHYKEPWFNSSLLIKNSRSTKGKPRINIKGGRNQEILEYEFNGDKMELITTNRIKN